MARMSDGVIAPSDSGVPATARAGVCKTLGFLGVELDMEKNKVRSKEAIISTENSKVTVCVIPTDEELMIATDTMELLKK